MLTKFSVGQIWNYHCRKHETESRIYIVRIDSEDSEYGNIIHIYISNVDIPNPEAPRGKTIFIEHMPYQESALENSVTSLESETTDLPEYQAGYDLWKEALSLIHISEPTRPY